MDCSCTDMHTGMSLRPQHFSLLRKIEEQARVLAGMDN